MSAPTAAAIFRQVIDAVISNSRSDFEDDGVDESLLEELLRGWEGRIVRERISGFEPVSEGLVAAGQVTPHHDAEGAQEPYDGADYYGDMLQRAAYEAQDTSEYDTTYAGESATATSLAALADASHQQYSSEEEEQHHYAAEGAGEKEAGDAVATIPQNDGAADEEELTPGPTADRGEPQWSGERRSLDRSSTASSIRQPPPATFASSFSAQQPQGAELSPPELGPERSHARPSGRLLQFDGGDDGDNSDDINSDLDDSDEETNDATTTDNLEHIILCQYDKVTRSKNKWRCVLKDGIMLINKQEYLFHKATGEFEW